MSLIQLSLKHGTSVAEARDHLARAVTETTQRFSLMVERVEWAQDKSSVDIQGKGFDVQMRVDDSDVHVAGNIPVLGRLLGAPALKTIVEQSFKRLPK
ncbi:MAG: polyhydroxyalkanoic acid system family protein [Pirellulales bacterium]|nr:polyhydroxyalkanoic acid system family protein [Pirellulales bacterium]